MFTNTRIIVIYNSLSIRIDFFIMYLNTILNKVIITLLIILLIIFKL